MHDSENQAESIFANAWSLDQKDRAAYLDEVCRGAPELRRQVEELLAEDERAGNFLMKPLLPAWHGNASERIGEGAPGSPADGGSGAPNAPQFQAGDLVYARFAVVRYIARGGMGEVYEVEDLQLKGARVALKTILSHFAADPLMHDRFKREVLVAREILHPNVCPIYDLFVWDRPEGRLLFLTMKLLMGETLMARLARDGRLPLEEIAAITRQVGSGLAAAHAAGMLHRDIKAANIMLSGVGPNVYACIMDFGLARPIEEESTALTAHGVPGTPGYVAPELFFGGLPSQSSDVFAFGVVVYQMFAGRLPKNAITQPQTRKELQEADAPAPWRRMVENCLLPTPATRCNDIVSALHMVPGLAPESNPRSGPAALGAHAPLFPRRRVMTLAGAVAAASAFGAWVEWETIRLWFEPIPKKRFVALLAWPDSESSSVVQVILSSIETRLARIEVIDRNLLIIAPRDIQGAAEKATSPAACVKELGANLVLAASIHSSQAVATLTLQVLDAATQRVLRRIEIKSEARKISSVVDAALAAALRLLNLPEKDTGLTDEEELKGLPSDVFAAFSEAEQLANQLTEASLNSSILKFEQVLHDQPHFALGYARLALAYARLLHLTDNPALLDLAAGNVRLAQRYNPHSLTALFGHALALLYSGHPDEALKIIDEALRLDPDNPEFLFYRALAYRNLGGETNLEKAADIYLHIVDDVRPNYWPAYNEYGFVLARQKKYDEAVKQFEKAGAVAPNVGIPLANLATMYLQKDDHGDPKQKQANKAKAIEACQLSLTRGSNDQANLILGDYAFLDRDYRKALAYYRQAARDDPHNHMTWRNIADCYAVLGNQALVQENYGRAADTLRSFLAVNPSQGTEWAALAFYDAKIHDLKKAQVDLDNAGLHHATDVDSQFMISQALVLMNRKDEALTILLNCIDKGLSLVDVDLALDLASLRKDPRYIAHIAQLRRSKNGTSS